MVTAHHAAAFLVIVVSIVAAVTALVAYRRGAARRIVPQLLALAQTVLVAEVGLGLLLLAGHKRAADKLHYMYGSLALLAVVAPWIYAPPDARRRLLWFGAATLLAGVLSVRAYMTAT
jgi:hypothetical protein